MRQLERGTVLDVKKTRHLTMERFSGIYSFADAPNVDGFMNGKRLRRNARYGQL